MPRELEKQDDAKWLAEERELFRILMGRVSDVHQFIEMAALRGAYSTGLHVSKHAHLNRAIEQLAVCQE